MATHSLNSLVARLNQLHEQAVETLLQNNTFAINTAITTDAKDVLNELRHRKNTGIRVWSRPRSRGRAWFKPEAKPWFMRDPHEEIPEWEEVIKVCHGSLPWVTDSVERLIGDLADSQDESVERTI